jgi:hypothetical protein
MAWDYTFPITNGVTEWAAWQWVIQFWKACRERAWACGDEHFPRTTVIEDPADWPTSFSPDASGSAPGYTGIIDSAPSASGANYVVTDASNMEFNPDVTVWAPEAKAKNWTPANRWYDYVHPVDSRYPRFFDIVIEYTPSGALPEPHRVVRAKILGSGTTTLTVEGGPLDDAVEAKQIPSVAALSGMRYCIVRQDKTSHRSVHWHDRWPVWPNCDEFARGNVELPTLTTITDHHARWEPNQHVGRELMTRSAGRLKRFVITSNARDTLTFTSRGVVPTAGDRYAIIPAGGVWRYGPEPSALRRWYSGADTAMDGIEVDPRFYSHWPDHSIQPTPVPALTIKLMQPDPTGTVCEEADVDAFEVDVWSPPDADTDPLGCDELDRPYSPWFYRTFRSLQGWVEGVCMEFVEKKSYDGVDAVPLLTPATWGKAAGFTTYTTTVASASLANMRITLGAALSLPAGLPLPVVVHYTILNADGSLVTYGHTYAASTVNSNYGHLTGLLTSTTHITMRGAAVGENNYPPPQTDMDAWAGLTIIVSLGYQRYYPRRVRTVRPRTVFVASNGVADPTEANPGVYGTGSYSGTSLSDGSKSGSAFWNGTTGRWVGFVVEVLIDGVWHRRPITGHTVASQTISWAEALPGTGTEYRIREPMYELNKWKGATVRIFLPGVTVEREITHSDDDTLYFASIATELAQAAGPDGVPLGLTAIPAGTSYHIIDHQPGAVLRWNSTTGKWEKPTGNDPRTGLPFLSDLTANLPTLQRRFGRIRKGDYIHPTLFHELRDGINALVWQRGDGHWEKDLVENPVSSDDQNWKYVETVAGFSDPPLKEYMVERWGTEPPFNDSSALPHATARLFEGMSSGTHWAAYMYAVIDNVRTARMQHTAVAHAYTSTDADDVGAFLIGDDDGMGGTRTHSQYFRAHGSGARYRKISQIGSEGPSTATRRRVKVGSLNVPDDWPPDPGVGDNFNLGGWSVAKKGGTGDPSPIVIIKWNVTGGMQYVADAAAGGSGGMSSGEFGIDL